MKSQKATAQKVPARFARDAKEVWKDTPLVVQAEINRALSELESGLTLTRDRASKIISGSSEMMRTVDALGPEIKAWGFDVPAQWFRSRHEIEKRMAAQLDAGNLHLAITELIVGLGQDPIEIFEHALAAPAVRS